MPVFQYKAVNSLGQPVEGSEFGPDSQTVIAALLGRGLEIESVVPASVGYDPLAETPAPSKVEETPATEPAAEESSGPPTDPRPFFQANVIGPLVGGVPLAQLQFFFRQTSAMLNAGINPVDAFETIAKQTSSPVLKGIIKETGQHVLAGRPISVGLQRYPEVFSPLMVSMVRVGERSGLIAEQCRQVAEYIQRDMELRNLIRRETAYPKMVLWASAIIILLTNSLITYGLNKPNAQTLPVPYMVWVVLIGLAAFTFFMNRYGLQVQHIKQMWDGFLLWIPGIGQMIQGFAMAKFGRAFAALYKSGVPVGESMKLSADSMGNEALRARIHPAAIRIDEGHGIAKTLQETGAFSPIVLDMANTGEMTGNLDSMMEKVAEYYEDEGQTNARKGATVLGFVCLLLAGVYVLYIVVSFFTGYANQVGNAVG